MELLLHRKKLHIPFSREKLEHLISLSSRDSWVLYLRLLRKEPFASNVSFLVIRRITSKLSFFNIRAECEDNSKTWLCSVSPRPDDIRESFKPTKLELELRSPVTLPVSQPLQIIRFV